MFATTLNYSIKSKSFFDSFFSTHGLSFEMTINYPRWHLCQSWKTRSSSDPQMPLSLWKPPGNSFGATLLAVVRDDLKLPTYSRNPSASTNLFWRATQNEQLPIPYTYQSRSMPLLRTPSHVIRLIWPIYHPLARKVSMSCLSHHHSTSTRCNHRGLPLFGRQLADWYKFIFVIKIGQIHNEVFYNVLMP